MIKKIKNIVSIFVIGMILQSCGEEMGGVECIRFDVEDFGENWDDSETTTVDGVDGVVIYKYKGEKFTGTFCFGTADNSGLFTKEDLSLSFKWGKGMNALSDIQNAINYGSKNTQLSGTTAHKAFQSRISYKDGLKNGLEIGWAKYSYDRIDTAYVINWKNGYMDGKAIWYAYGDQPCDTCKNFSEVSNYKKGKADGPFFEYGLIDLDSDGVDENFVRKKGTFKNNKIHGSLKFYETIYRDEIGKRVVYLKSDNKYYRGKEYASKKYYNNEEISLAYSKSISVNWYPRDDDEVYYDTIVDAKKYLFNFNSYNRWEMSTKGCRGGLADTWTQTIKNGVRYICEQDSNINLKSPILEGWGYLVFIDKK